MDLAETIRMNTAAVQALTEAIQRMGGLPAAEIATAPLQVAQPPVEQKPLTFAELKPLVFKVAQSHRDALVGILTGYGVKKAADVPPAKLPEFKAALEALS